MYVANCIVWRTLTSTDLWCSSVNVVNCGKAEGTHVPAQRAGKLFFRGTRLPTAVRKNQPLVPRSNLGGKVCARTDPWFRGQTLLVPGHGGGGGNTVKNQAMLDCVPIVEEKRGCVMLVMSPPAHSNILLGTAPHCSLFQCDFPKKPHSKACCQACPNACPKGQAFAIVQDEAQGWKGLLFHSS